VWFSSVPDIKIFIKMLIFKPFSPQDKYNKRKLIRGFELSLKQEDKHKAKSIVNDILTGKAINVLLKSKLTDTFKIKNKR